MENEIELKIVLKPENIAIFLDFLSSLPLIKQGKDQLANTYYDSKHHDLAKQKMGFRVRAKNHQYEMTLKMAGDSVGGLHIRPEYNLALEDAKPNFKRLVSHYNLQFSDNTILNSELLPTFSTDFERRYWLIQFQQSVIEVALDQGEIRNPYGQESICEIELELKQGYLSDLFDFLSAMPKRDGMWLSSLSKAHRGYLLGEPQKIAKEIEKVTACCSESLDEKMRYQLCQEMADLIRMTSNVSLFQQYQNLVGVKFSGIDYLFSAAYLAINIAVLKRLFLVQ